MAPRATTSNNAKELGQFLRAHRERRDPAEVGLPITGRRRTPGLRREEVATLSGVGVSWYTWLEQGRVIPSRQVLESVGRTLGLRGAALRHLLILGGLAGPDGLAGADSGFTGSMQVLLDGWVDQPALLLDGRFDMVAWNAAYRAVWSDPALVPAERRNLMWWAMGDPVLRHGVPDWEGFARAVLAQFRADTARRGDDPRVQELYRLLHQDFPEFGDWWTCQGVADFGAQQVTLRLAEHRELRLLFSALRPVSASDHLLIVQAPLTPADRSLIAELIGDPAVRVGRAASPAGPPGRPAHRR
ncbi:helix-turn-helix transcriptional regulator [Enemella evansiae]|uniref:helix-turn-helix transcriptional regulator n=1 Tax=Enemella evansiae TaxID=2016499 RepID=UPI0015C67F12|nr:helix-turn-helix transcriptional regulator [Enemella evansiae]